MNNQWLKETNDIIADWEAEYNSLQSKYERIAGELMDLRQRIAVAHELISAYMEKHDESSENPTIIITNLTNKSYPKILVEAAKQNNGIIDVSVLVDILVKADMGTPAQVRHNIDNALYRNKEHFARIGRGRYRFTNHIQGTEDTKRESSGIRDIVGEIKSNHPEWSKAQVINYLKETGFDTKGKNLKGAVNMAWVWWGFHKEGKQQSLLT